MTGFPDAFASAASPAGSRGYLNYLTLRNVPESDDLFVVSATDERALD
jgi:hypothetical protein